jgi:hypothetical protein
MFTNIDVVPESTYASQIKEKPSTLWMGLLTGPIVYALYFIVGYLLVEMACQTGVLQTTVGGLSLYAVIVLALTLFAALVTLLTGLSNFRRWRQHAADHATDTDHASPFMVFGSLLLSILFTSLILLTGIPILVIQSCRWI